MIRYSRRNWWVWNVDLQLKLDAPYDEACPPVFEFDEADVFLPPVVTEFLDTSKKIYSIISKFC